MKLMPNSCALCFFFGLLSSPFKDTLAAETQWREPEGSSLVAQGNEQNVPSGVGSPGAVKTPLTVALNRQQAPLPPWALSSIKNIKSNIFGHVGIKTNILLHIKTFSFI